jgi:regulator of cell morphogenesis and NO signaling
MIARAHDADRTVSRHLTADHARLDAMFDDACTRVGAGDFIGAIGRFHAFSHGLQHHIDVEERFLFPVFDARVPMRGPTTVMRHEHRSIEQLLARAGASLRAHDAAQFATDAAELAALLQAHNLKEERVLYPRTDSALDDAERAELVTALELY